MKSQILKVIAQTETTYVQSRKNENGQVAKCYIRLQELGGEHEDEYLCALYGGLAERRFEPGKLVAAGSASLPTRLTVLGIRTSWLTKSFKSIKEILIT